MGDHPSGIGLVVRNRVVIVPERFQCISMANIVASILFVYHLQFWNQGHPYFG